MEEADGSVSTAESALPGTVTTIMYIPESGQSAKEGYKGHQRDGEDHKGDITDEAHQELQLRVLSIVYMRYGGKCQQSVNNKKS